MVIEASGRVGIVFSKTEVSQDTYDLLLLLNINPTPITLSGTIERYRRALSWIRDREEHANTSLLAFSGEADPRVWNAVKEDITAALEKGMKYAHCLGPVVCTDENGRNAILEIYAEFPDEVELYLTRTRAIYHWTCFTDSNGGLLYQLSGECYHRPLVGNRRNYFIFLEKEDDPFLSAKTVYWHNRQRDYLWRKPIMDKVVKTDQVPTVSFSQLKTAYDRMEKKGLDLNLTTAKEIIAFSRNVKI